jgi:hypothetical protein
MSPSTYIESQVQDDTLANRARVSVAPETWDKAAESTKSAQFRIKGKPNREKLLDFIKTAPYGEPVNTLDICKGANIPRGSITQLLKKMLKAGDIYQHDITPFSHFYTIAEPVKTTKPSTPAKPATPKPQARPMIAPSRILLPFAKDYAWEHPDDAPTIKRFFYWVQGDTDDRA